MRKAVLSFALVVVVGAIGVSAASATNWWGGYHWARTANPFTLKLGDNLSSGWKSYLGTTSSDWSQSTVLDTTIVTGKAKGKCQPTAGRVEVCNGAYGRNGWLGLAQIWISGKHITQGAVKVNDTYFNTSTYNSSAWRNLVMCQEVGHTFGLDHQDEVFGNPNLGTCMDYTSDPSTNQHPNQHDYDELAFIYSHTDATTTLGSSSGGGHGKPQRVRDDLWVEDLGNGQRLYTFVYWATTGKHEAPQTDD
jgi:hypothetical protein